MTFAIFHDFPGLEIGLPKFHDFPWPGGTLYYRCCSQHIQQTYLIISLTSSYLIPILQHSVTVHVMYYNVLNSNNNIPISIVPYGRNFRGTGVTQVL